jgi:hypothetical protein
MAITHTAEVAEAPGKLEMAVAARAQTESDDTRATAGAETWGTLAVDRQIVAAWPVSDARYLVPFTTAVAKPSVDGPQVLDWPRAVAKGSRRTNATTVKR